VSDGQRRGGSASSLAAIRFERSVPSRGNRKRSETMTIQPWGKHVLGLSSDAHLDANDVAGYVDGAMEPAARSHAAAHLASCDACRAEVADVSAVATAIRTRRHRRALLIPAGAVAAAVILLVMVPTGQAPRSARREPPLATVISPSAITPIGSVSSSIKFVWTSVPHADRYAISVFDSLGATLWQHETTDTSVAVPSTVHLHHFVPYYWRVEATTGFDRATQSDLVGFSVRPRAP